MSVKIRKYSDFVVSLEGFPQTLNIHNVRTTSVKSINLHTIRKLIEDSSKNFPTTGNVYSYRFRDIAV